MEVSSLNDLNNKTKNIQTQLDAKAPMASPGLTGTPTAPTATTGTNTTQVATTAFVRQELAGFSGGGGLPTNSQTFTSSGTFTVPTGVTKVMVFAHGGGGGGGGGYGTASGGGGGVGFIPQIIDVTPGQAMAVIIGSGGAGGATTTNYVPTWGSVGGSTFFGTWEFKGGNGGGGYLWGDWLFPAPGLSLYSGGMAGNKGSNSVNYSGGVAPANAWMGGGGGAGSGGNGGQAGSVPNWGMNSNGQPGQGYGAGGGGGVGATHTGGAGYQGILIVKW
jgi:hypothetical protein